MTDKKTVKCEFVCDKELKNVEFVAWIALMYDETCHYAEFVNRNPAFECCRHDWMKQFAVYKPKFVATHWLVHVFTNRVIPFGGHHALYASAPLCGESKDESRSRIIVRDVDNKVWYTVEIPNPPFIIEWADRTPIPAMIYDADHDTRYKKRHPLFGRVPVAVYIKTMLDKVASAFAGPARTHWRADSDRRMEIYAEWAHVTDPMDPLEILRLPLLGQTYHEDTTAYDSWEHPMCNPLACISASVVDCEDMCSLALGTYMQLVHYSGQNALVSRYRAFLENYWPCLVVCSLTKDDDCDPRARHVVVMFIEKTWIDRVAESSSRSDDIRYKSSSSHRNHPPLLLETTVYRASHASKCLRRLQEAAQTLPSSSRDCFVKEPLRPSEQYSRVHRILAFKFRSPDDTFCSELCFDDPSDSKNGDEYVFLDHPSSGDENNWCYHRNARYMMRDLMAARAPFPSHIVSMHNYKQDDYSSLISSIYASLPPVFGYQLHLHALQHYTPPEDNNGYTQVYSMSTKMSDNTQQNNTNYIMLQQHDEEFKLFVVTEAS